MTSVAAAYLFNSVSMQMKELEVLGTEYTLRFFLSVMMMCVVLFFLGSYRMYYDCESVTVVILSNQLNSFTYQTQKVYDILDNSVSIGENTDEE
jgi:uncharacterized membrane protein YkgB